jgi:hypothetical protein
MVSQTAVGVSQVARGLNKKPNYKKGTTILKNNQ